MAILNVYHRAYNRTDRAKSRSARKRHSFAPLSESRKYRRDYHYGAQGKQQLECTFKLDTDHIKQYDSSFHEVIYRLSGSAVLRDLLIPLHKKVQKYRKTSVESDSRALDSLAEHKSIYEAIMDRDPARAEEEMRRHVMNAKAHITRCQGGLTDTRDAQTKG